MGDPLRSPLSFGLRIQAHSQAKSLPTCVQRTKDKISNFAFKIFKKSRQFYWRHAHAHSTHTQIVGCLLHKLTLSRIMYLDRQTNNCTTNPRGGMGGHGNGSPIDNYIKNTLSLRSNGVFYSING